MANNDPWGVSTNDSERSSGKYIWNNYDRLILLILILRGHFSNQKWSLCIDLLVSGTESEEPSISSDDTKTNTEKSFRDNFIDKNIDDKDLNSDTNGNADLPTSNFEPMKDSKEYIGMKWNSKKFGCLIIE